MRIDLSDDAVLRSFERDVVALIAASHLLRAEYVVREAIDRSASARLKSASDLPLDGAAIAGWSNLCADLLDANELLEQRASLAVLSLVNRALLSGGFVDGLEIERRFHVAFARENSGRIIPDRDAGYHAPSARQPVFVIGLEALMAVQRTPWPSPPIAAEVQHGFAVDQALCGLLLVVAFHRLVDRYLRTEGFPEPVNLLVEMDRTPWPMEAGVHDLGPQAQRFIAAPDIASQPPSAATQIRAERQAETKAAFQREIATALAELREQYRLVRMFPFYRFKARDQLAEILTGSLKLWCQSQSLPEAGVDWSMSKRDFERLLRRIAEVRQVPSVEDALDVRHVDALHDKWLAVAREKNFDLGSTPMSLFELNLAWSLKVGGSIVQDRWVHAKPYRIT